MPNATQTPLSANNRSILQRASREEVAAALGTISMSDSADWLESTNIYKVAAQDQIQADKKTIPAASQADFGRYLSASSFVHCGDAWGYLGRAIDSLIRGDLQSAVHLTYYAELRGALSLLASEGIYIGNGANFVLTKGGSVELVTGDSTHIAAWKYMAAWNDEARSSSLIAKILRPGGITLASWAQNVPGSGVKSVVSELLTRMAFDLKSFSNDRIRRNTASYTPTRLATEDLTVDKTTNIISQLWQALEPNSRGTFPVLDQLILRDVLKASYSPTHQVKSSDGSIIGNVDWAAWDHWLEQITPTETHGTALFEDLRLTPIDPTMSSLFEKNGTSASPVDFIEAMLDRTAVLLRLATGSCVHLLEESTLTHESIAPWIESLSVVRGLWDSSDLPEDNLDLWSDVDLARTMLDDSKFSSPHALLKSMGSDLLTLGQTERVVAWSFE